MADYYKFGKFMGFTIMFFLFSSILYLILRLLDKFPIEYGYFHIYLFTLFIVLVGILIKLSLK